MLAIKVLSEAEFVHTVCFQSQNAWQDTFSKTAQCHAVVFDLQITKHRQLNTLESMHTFIFKIITLYLHS